MSDNIRMGSSSIFAEMLTATFIVLKLCGVISWSWWWVLSPLWITAGVVVGVFVVAGIVVVIGALFENRR